MIKYDIVVISMIDKCVSSLTVSHKAMNILVYIISKLLNIFFLNCMKYAGFVITFSICYLLY